MSTTSSNQANAWDVLLELPTDLTVPCELRGNPEEYLDEILSCLAALQHGLGQRNCCGAGVPFELNGDTEVERIAKEVIVANLPYDSHVFIFRDRIYATTDVDQFAEQLVDEEHERVAQAIKENGATARDVQEKYGQVDDLEPEPVQDPYEEVALTAEEDQYRHWPAEIGEYERFVPDSTDHPPILPYGNGEWDTTILCMAPEFTGSGNWRVIQLDDSPNNVVGQGLISDDYNPLESYTVPNELAATVALSAIAEQRDDLEELLLQSLAGIDLFPEEVGEEVSAASISPRCSEELMVVVRDIIALEIGDQYRIAIHGGEVLAIDNIDSFVQNHVCGMEHEEAVYEIVEASVNRREAIESMRDMLGGGEDAE
ncbi:hypothetical protein SAMN05444422_10620 [Halobiforma haloterrestris]|uniref:Uncharacterized protein n=1 Tax=Natronobacterium haloterrestre TaxID=148448 RepID=A0A1I1HJG5_NATHA|nr:hypothetical protein [Halobiforma haloterrestris]SFC24104.1 hypothetical protein SAMN05444422_10620 [Halobiforma haloterrestris]